MVDRAQGNIRATLRHFTKQPVDKHREINLCNLYVLIQMILTLELDPIPDQPHNLLIVNKSSHAPETV